MKIVFMGTPQAAAPSLERLIDDGHEIVGVYTQPDRPAGRGNKIAASPVKQFALEHSLTLHQPVKIRSAEAVDVFRRHEADVAVVIAYGRILPWEFLTAYPFGAVNVHFSLLPKYRGAAPVNWAIVNGEAATGVTTIQMDAGLDTGPVLLQEKIAIRPDETSVDLLDRLAHLAPDVLSRTLAALESIVPQPQNDAEATFAPMLTREDGRIDWSMNANDIVNRVRGFQPFPMAWTTFHGKHLTIWKATRWTCDQPAAVPGAIVNAEGDEMVVACGDGTLLRIHELQPEGKRRMSARDFINGMHPAIGELLGAAS
jgi:methionyl-tRNA formyltransferase